jgi:hypothetical protein
VSIEPPVRTDDLSYLDRLVRFVNDLAQQNKLPPVIDVPTAISSPDTKKTDLLQMAGIPEEQWEFYEVL